MAKTSTKLGPVALSSDVPQCRGMMVTKTGTKLGPVGLSSDVLSFQEYFAIDHLHFSYVTPQCPQHPHAPCWPLDVPTLCPPLVQASWSRVVLLHISMTCHQPVGQADVLSDGPHPITPYAPQYPGSGTWWPRVVLTWVPLT